MEPTKLYSILTGGTKRLMGVATIEEAKKSFDHYYGSNYRRKLMDMMYQIKPEYTLTTCEDPAFIACRKKHPNKDGKGTTCLDIADKVCPKKSKGSKE